MTDLFAELAVLAWGDESAVAAFAARCDRLDAERETRLTEPCALLRTALWYAQLGIPVFRVRPREKVPYAGSRGCKDATTDASQIRQWWTTSPTANIGIATGFVIDVFDIDGPAGYRSVADLRDTGMLPPILGKTVTPRGGMHLYVAATGDGNGAGILPGLDYRGAGGYVLAPPSMGANGSGYRWTTPLELP